MKWEYKIVYINAQTGTKSGLPENINEEFDRYGSQGWELVKIEPKLEGGTTVFIPRWRHQTVGYIAFFKKPLE